MSVAIGKLQTSTYHAKSVLRRVTGDVTSRQPSHPTVGSVTMISDMSIVWMVVYASNLKFDQMWKQIWIWNKATVVSTLNNLAHTSVRWIMMSTEVLTNNERDKKPQHWRFYECRWNVKNRLLTDLFDFGRKEHGCEGWKLNWQPQST